MKIYHAIIAGAGPSGLAAGMYLGRLGFDVLVADKDPAGGQARMIERVENYPGFPDGVAGGELMRKFTVQAKRWNVRFARTVVRRADRDNGSIAVSTTAGTLRSHSFILCSGAVFKTLGIPGEKKFAGNSVFHGAFDRARRFQGSEVVVIGGGDAAVHQTLLLARYAARVHLIFRSERLSANTRLVRGIDRFSNLKLWPGRRVTAFKGRGRLEYVATMNGARTVPMDIPCDAAFVLIGKEPAHDFRPSGRERHGFFCAGDIRQGPYRQIAVASGDGIRAAMSCERWLERRRPSPLRCTQDSPAFFRWKNAGACPLPKGEGKG